MSVCLSFTMEKKKTTVGETLPPALIVRLRHAEMTALTAGEGEVLFHMCNNITSLTCAEVNYRLVTQKCKWCGFKRAIRCNSCCQALRMVPVALFLSPCLSFLSGRCDNSENILT